MTKLFYKTMKGKPCFYRTVLVLAVSFLGLETKAENNRIVGYLPYYRFDLVDQMELDKLTHLIIGFGHPNAQGRIEVPKVDIWPVVKKARTAGVKVLLALGGGGLEEEEEKNWAYYLRPGKRAEFIRNIVQYAEAYELDGIDVDLEWDHVNQYYSDFVLDLNRTLKSKAKILTAALPATHRYKHLNDEALSAFDFINLMAYDLTGPWRPDRPGQHSPFSFAVNSIDFWKEQGVSPQRLTLGLPVFGWNFSHGESVSSITYRELVEMDASFALLDRIGRIYYNGLPLIRAKTELALREVSGVMLWELGQDAYNDLSVLRAVHQIMYPDLYKSSDKDLIPETIALNHSTVLGSDLPLEDRLHFERRFGRLTLVRRRNGRDELFMPIPKYPPAFYFSVHWAHETLKQR